MSSMLMNLLSGLGGALIGAAVTLLVARKQLTLLTQHHAEALAHQNSLLQRQFEQQLQVQREQLRLSSIVRFAEDIRAHLATSARGVYLAGHQLRNDWAGRLSRDSDEYCSAIQRFRSDASDVVRAYAQILENHRHHRDLSQQFQNLLSFQSLFFPPIGEFLGAIAKLPKPISREAASLLNDHGAAFNAAVGHYDKWISDAQGLATLAQEQALTIDRPNEALQPASLAAERPGN